MKPITLVIMAAGLGSRFGGPKQVTPVDDEGHIIMDYSIYDALRAGFDKVVIIIKPDKRDEFEAAIGSRMRGKVDLVYAPQDISMLPSGFSVPEGRTKPWGTAHAVLCAREFVHGPFAAINADDFYGFGAFKALYAFLSDSHAENEHAMVGYRVENTLTENGYVSRGVCGVDENGMLSGVDERTKIRPCEGGAEYTEDGGETFTFIPEGTVVSMNFWGFQESIFAEMEKRFADFLQNDAVSNPLKAEFYLPSVPHGLIRRGEGSVKVLSTDEKWFGVTYPQDLDSVKAAIARMKEEGAYPARLWD